MKKIRTKRTAYTVLLQVPDSQLMVIISILNVSEKKKILIFNKFLELEGCPRTISRLRLTLTFDLHECTYTH